MSELQLVTVFIQLYLSSVNRSKKIETIIEILISEDAIARVASPQSPSPFPFLPIPYPFRRLVLRRLTTRRQRERQKTVGLISKATTLHLHQTFLYISLAF